MGYEGKLDRAIFPFGIWYPDRGRVLPYC